MDETKHRVTEDWIPEVELEKLRCEKMVEPDLTDEERARKILWTAAPMAAQSIAWLSVHAVDHSVRFKAATYITDGVVAGKLSRIGGSDDVLLALVEELSKNDPESVAL